MMTNGLLPHDDHDGTHAPQGKRHATKLRALSSLLSLYVVELCGVVHWCVRGMSERGYAEGAALYQNSKRRETETWRCCLTGSVRDADACTHSKKTQGQQVTKAQQ